MPPAARRSRPGGAELAAGAGRRREAGVADLDHHLLQRHAHGLGGDLGHDGVGAGADVGHALRAAATVPSALDPHGGLGRQQEVAADGRGHAHADQPAAVAHLAGLRIAAHQPNLSAPSRMHSISWRAEYGCPGLRMPVRLVADAQLDGIDAEPVGQLVHRRIPGSSCPSASPGARMALATAMSSCCRRCAGQPVRRGVEGAREVGGALDERGVAVAVRGGFSSDTRSAARPASRRARTRCTVARAVDRGVEHLLAGQRDLHRLAQRPRGQRRQRQVLVAASPCRRSRRRHRATSGARRCAWICSVSATQVLRPLDHLHRGVDLHLAVSHQAVVAQGSIWQWFSIGVE